MDEQQQQKLNELINHIKLSEKIEKECEGMRLDILENVHQRMDKYNRKISPFKIAAIAASVAILIAISGTLGYRTGTNTFNSEPIQVCCPPGIRSTLTLPDGSSVILNGGTTLSYPSRFAANQREIKLEGEAFFDVQKNPDAPFIVQSGKINVRVLGTRFNVEAYREDEIVKVTLESGKVCMNTPHESLILTPNQQATYNKTTAQLSKTEINANEETAWKSNHLLFNGIALEQIAKRLERQFNVCIIIESEKLKSTLYTGEFTENETIDDILTVWTLDKRIKYKREGRILTIYE